MRILTGEARGRILQTPSGTTTRPTDSRSREMLFNVLGDRVIGARFLDCYAGCGSVGLEALSRGAEHCVFVEQDFGAVRSLRANIKLLGWEKRAQVWNGNVRTALQKLVDNGERFDIIFGDPPFNHPTETREFCNRADAAFSLLQRDEIAPPPAGGGETTGGGAPDEEVRCDEAAEPEATPKIGMLVVQHHRRFVPQALQHFELRREKRAGESSLSFFLPVPAALAVAVAITPSG